MKKLLSSVALIVISIISANAQLVSPTTQYKEGISLGLEKNKILFLEYAKNGFVGRVKQTLIADKAKYQYFRVEGGYDFQTEFVDMAIDVFYSSEWLFESYNIGSQISFTSSIYDKYGNIAVRYIPYYDKDLKFNNGWSVSGKLNVTETISFVAEYGRVPDFRIAYKRLYLGAIFTVKNLSVYPILEIPLYDNEIHLSHSQVCVSLSYTLGKWL